MPSNRIKSSRCEYQTRKGKAAFARGYARHRKISMSSEKFVAELLGRHLGVDFGTARRSLDEWGKRTAASNLERTYGYC